MCRLVQDGRRLIVSCEPILQEDYCDSDSVISCIYREETDTCFVTSVDVIYLLERLTNGEFPVEEKNRIRRNLEGLRPTTVSKHKPGFGEFFQRIMEFPDPKPRNIEKDLKVFDWNLLGQALEKILAKYSIYTTPATDSAESSSIEAPVDAESPELYAPQLSYPPPEDPSESRFLDQKMCIPKFEPIPAEMPLSVVAPITIPKDHDADHFPSPVESVGTASSSSSSAFPLFAGHSSSDLDPRAMDSRHWTHDGDFKSGDMALENFNNILSSYEVSEPVNGSHYPDGPGLDFNMYDNFSFHGIHDDALANLADHYI
ncbi:hypothetical protein NLJ89_g5518 [Agrocybe chaxingu]|uniref:DUF7082 domain-containing protein n=1 Tax=Agrocybe chaxingu TaxID=84603 RepID=A0A9W8MVI5_9AGAR|nr:hypothetical protein NLJ89_g5518 [Agrocybe chaxingu]